MPSAVVGRFFTTRKKAKQFKKDKHPTFLIIQPMAGGFLVISPKTLLHMSQLHKK